MTTTEECLADLVCRGYQEIEAIDGIRSGSRVRHIGEQFGSALTNGTADVVAVMEKSPSSWSQKYTQRDIEVVVYRTDKRPTATIWAHYQVVVV